MWSSAEITIEIDEVDHPVMIVTITAPVGVLEMIGAVTMIGRTLRIDNVHVQGLAPGALGRAGLNAIGRKLLEEANADEIVIKGGARTTGAGPKRGRRPPPFRYPR